MLIGVRFCGGCNPKYDRKAYLGEIIKTNPHHKLEFAEEERKYDVLLCIGGCSSCCVTYDQFDYEKVMKIWDPTDAFNID